MLTGKIHKIAIIQYPLRSTNKQNWMHTTKIQTLTRINTCRRTETPIRADTRTCARNFPHSDAQIFHVLSVHRTYPISFLTKPKPVSRREVRWPARPRATHQIEQNDKTAGPAAAAPEPLWRRWRRSQRRSLHWRRRPRCWCGAYWHDMVQCYLWFEKWWPRAIK